MEAIQRVRRPPAALIKLVECVGILLSLPKSYQKSNFKAPVPSNYDATLVCLNDDFYAKLAILAKLQSSDIDNEVAAEFYAKMLEPGVDYEDAVNVGGLAVRELFNAVLLVLLKLQSDPLRLPVANDNIMTVVDGSRASYVALDTAAHVCTHGVLHIALSTDKQHLLTFLEADVIRRCKLHYKLPAYRYVVHSIFSGNDCWPDSELSLLLSHCHEKKCSSMVLPYTYSLGEFKFLSCSYQHFAVSKFAGDAIFTQNMSYVRPLTEIKCGRTFIVYIDSMSDCDLTVMKALRYFRAGDCMVLLGVFPPPEPMGDSRELRFDFGQRQQWTHSSDFNQLEPNRIGWNKEVIERFQAHMDDLIAKSFLTGSRVRVEHSTSRQSLAQLICNVGREENAMGLMLRLPGNEEIISECLADQPFSIFILK
jgi:hypothetical protein